MRYFFTECSFAKMILHAIKYPTLGINGILLASRANDYIVDAIPLFHQNLYVTPLAEVALMQIDNYAKNNYLIIAGYYVASDHFNENSIDKMPASKIAEKIYEHNKNACFVIIDNKQCTKSPDIPVLKVFYNNGSIAKADTIAWLKADYTLTDKLRTLEKVSLLRSSGAAEKLFDFDNYLDNPACDWTNQYFNRDLKKMLTE